MKPDFEGRWSRLYSELEQSGLDGLVVSSLPNIRYLSGFTGSSGVLLAGPAGLSLLTDFRYEAQVSGEVASDIRSEIISVDLWAQVAKCFPEGRVGYEDSIDVKTFGRLSEEIPTGARLEATSGLVESLREAKEDFEVELIRQAAQMASEVFHEVAACIGVGQTETEIAARIEFELRKRGSEWHPFTTIVASGPRTALPHARSSLREVSVGDLLLFDFGAIVDGYCSDITRMAILGAEPDDKQALIHRIVSDAQENAKTAILPGMTGKEADQLARGVIEKAGFGSEFGHSLGHGIGLEVHEGPRLSRQSEVPLPTGAVVTIEPGVYIPGWGGVRLEDDVYLGADSVRVLSDGRTELHRI